eukprot:12035538-Heterocapsa_arctica.AAC.1
MTAQSISVVLGAVLRLLISMEAVIMHVPPPRGPLERKVEQALKLVQLTARSFLKIQGLPKLLTGILARLYAHSLLFVICHVDLATCLLQCLDLDLPGAALVHVMNRS